MKRWPRTWPLVLGAGLLLGLGILGVPHTASAFHLEAGGHKLEHGAGPARFEEAERHLHQALAWDPGNAQAYYLLARSQRLRGEPQAAAATLARYVHLRPGEPLALWELATLCEELPAADIAAIAGQPCGNGGEESRRTALASLWQAAGYSAASLVQLGDQQRAANEEQAEAAYRRALLLDPRSAAAWYGLGQIYKERGSTDAALEAYAQVVVLAPGPELVAAAHDQRAALWTAEGNWPKARQELARAVELVPQEGRYHSQLGWSIYKTGGSLQEAQAELLTAADLVPGDPWVYVLLAQVAVDGDDLETALAHANRAIQIRPTLAWGWIWQGRTLRLLGRLPEARKSLQQALTLASAQDAAHAEMGHLWKQMGRLDMAIDEYEQALELAPQNVWHNLSLASAYRDQGQFHQALTLYRRVLELEPGNAMAQQAVDELGARETTIP